MKLRKNDEVVVTAGKDKGKGGKIEHVFAKENKVVVAGINMYKRHRKGRGDNTPSGIIDIVKPMHVGKVSFRCPKCHQATRLGYITNGDKKKRICKSCKQEV